MGIGRCMGVIAISVACAWGAHAEPTLEIRARTDLDLNATRTERGLRASAVLLDDVGIPRPNTAIVLTSPLCGRRTCRTDATGRCTVDWEGCADERLRAEVPASGAFDASEVSIAVVDHGGQPRVELRLDDDDEGIDLDVPDFEFGLRIAGDADVQVVRFEDELGRVLAQRAVGRGDTRIRLSASSLGPPGVGALRVRATFVDGTTANAHRMIVRSVGAGLRLERARDALVATLVSRTGPLAGRVVTLEVDGSPARDARTDAAGKATFRLEESGEHRYRARFEGVPGYRGAASPELRAGSPVPWRRFGAALPFVTALAVLLFAVSRKRTSVAAKTTSSTAAPPPLPLQLGRRGSVIARDVGIAGRVLTEENGAPIEGAELRLESDGTVLARTDADGHFAASDLAPVAHAVTVHAEGRAPLTVRLTIPHQGQFRGMVIRLETVRSLARRAVDVVVEAAARAGEVPLALSLREADGRLPPTADEAFVEDTETTVYGPTEPVLDEARALLDRGRRRASGVPAAKR